MASPTSRGAYAVRIARLHQSWEQRLYRRASRLLADQGAAAATGYEEARGFGAENALKDAEGQWQSILRAHYEGLAPVFAREALHLVAPEPKADFRTLLSYWIRTMSLKRARRIAAGTVERLRHVVADLEDDGRPVGEVAKRIREVIGGAGGKARAATIARTETGIAASWSMQRSVEQLSIAPRVTREWVAVADARTRPAHAAIDGQRRSMSDDFDVPVYEGDVPTGRTVQMSRPKDPDGPADQVIQCRCVVRYLPPSFEEVLRA